MASPAAVAGIKPGVWRTVFADSEQADHAFAPVIQHAGRVSIGIDDAGCRTNTLHADGLPHDDLFVVETGGHDDQVARARNVDGVLDLLSRSQASWALATDSNGDGVDRFLAVTRRDDQFAATSTAYTTELCLLLDRAERHQVRTVIGQSDGDGGVTPTADIRSDPTDRDAACALRGAETIV